MNTEWIEQIRADSQVDIAQIRADADAERAEEMNALISGALTRIGSVVMLIWLVRIFVKKRQHSVKVTAFYLGVADAIAMAKEQSPSSFRDFLPHLLPPDTEEQDTLENPIEQLAKAVQAVKPST